MERKQQQTGTVTQLSTYRTARPVGPIQLSDRQLAVREHFLEAAARAPDEAPAALVGMSVLPDGKITSVALQVEPEHVIPVLSAMRIMMTKLESYLTSAVASRFALAVGIGAVIEVFDLVFVPALAAALI